MHAIGIHRKGNVGAVVDNENSPCLTHALCYPLRVRAEFTGRRVLIAELNKPDARRQKSRRHLEGGTAATLSRVNYGIEPGDYKLHEPTLDLNLFWIFDFGFWIDPSSLDFEFSILDRPRLNRPHSEVEVKNPKSDVLQSKI
jgi:hypothetical protein